MHDKIHTIQILHMCNPDMHACIHKLAYIRSLNYRFDIANRVCTHTLACMYVKWKHVSLSPGCMHVLSSLNWAIPYKKGLLYSLSLVLSMHTHIWFSMHVWVSRQLWDQLWHHTHDMGPLIFMYSHILWVHSLLEHNRLLFQTFT